MQIRKMTPEDLAEASAMAIRSKASWGYSPAEMEVFSRELTLETDYLESLLRAWVATKDGDIAGYCTLCRNKDGSIELDHLFVAPEHFHKGIGSELMRVAVRSAREHGATELTIVSDPNSLGFYHKHGAIHVGQFETCIPGRSIPIVKIPVTAGED